MQRGYSILRLTPETRASAQKTDSPPPRQSSYSPSASSYLPLACGLFPLLPLGMSAEQACS